MVNGLMPPKTPTGRSPLVAVLALSLLLGASLGCWSAVADLPAPKIKPELRINHEAAIPDAVVVRIGNRNDMDLEARCLLKPASRIPHLWHVLSDRPDVPANGMAPLQVSVLRQDTEHRLKCRFATKTYPLGFTSYSDEVLFTR